MIVEYGRMVQDAGKLNFRAFEVKLLLDSLFILATQTVRSEKVDSLSIEQATSQSRSQISFAMGAELLRQRNKKDQEFALQACTQQVTFLYRQNTAGSRQSSKSRVELQQKV